MGVPDLCARWRAINALQVAVGAWSSRCSADAPDSPVYTGHVRWIIAERLRCVPEAGQFRRPRFLGAPDTVRCTPDSPANYSGVASGISRRWRVWVGVIWCTGHVRWCTGHCPVVHRTVQWYTGQSGAPDQGCLRLPLCSFVESKTWSFYWLSVNLLHLYNLHTCAN